MTRGRSPGFAFVNNRVEALRLSEEGRCTLNDALEAVELILGGWCLLVVLVDRDGRPYLAPRPGQEVDAIKALMTMDLPLALRLAEEHS